MHPDPSIHTLTMYGVPLAVSCADCGHRTLISAHQLASRRLMRGTMTPIASLRLRCGECGGRNVEKTVPLNMAEAGRFVSGL